MSVDAHTLQHKHTKYYILYILHIHTYVLYGVHFQVSMRVSPFFAVVFSSTHRHRHRLRLHLFRKGIDVYSWNVEQ